MAKTITHTEVFKNTAPKALYDLYMDPEKHTHIIGGPAKITNREGDSFSAHNDYITGRNLRLVDGKLIVQTWRTQGWKTEDIDSIFILTLEPQGNDTVMTMVHANIPDEQVASIDKGWYDHYWNPWKQHLAGQQITRPQM